MFRLCLTLSLLLALLTAPTVHAQQVSLAEGSRLQPELCACVGAIPQDITNDGFERAVRACLENAIIHHPGEVLRLLERYPERKDKAFLVGLVLGSAMESGCGAFGPVKARLQQMPAPGTPSRKGT